MISPAPDDGGPGRPPTTSDRTDLPGCGAGALGVLERAALPASGEAAARPPLPVHPWPVRIQQAAVRARAAAGRGESPPLLGCAELSGRFVGWTRRKRDFAGAEFEADVAALAAVLHFR